MNELFSPRIQAAGQTRGRMLNYPESLIAHYTGIRQTEFCESILRRMYADCGGLSQLSTDEFKAAAIRAASDMFPAAMGIKK